MRKVAGFLLPLIFIVKPEFNWSEKMDVFKIPLILKPEDRKTVTASMLGKECLIKFPASLLKKKKNLVIMVDQVYWRLLAELNIARLKSHTAELNQCHFNLYYKEVRYHRQFRRWGSCSSLKNINISHRLIGAPEELVDYVILHELAHLQHLNHGKEFWDLLSVTGFNPRAIRKEIEHYGRQWQHEYYQWYSHILNNF
jgi:predicted metal-dependent hydrolase